MTPSSARLLVAQLTLYAETQLLRTSTVRLASTVAAGKAAGKTAGKTAGNAAAGGDGQNGQNGQNGNPRTLNEATGSIPHTYTRLADAPREGIATLSGGAAVRYSETWHSGTNVVDAAKADKKARAALSGLYVDLPGGIKSMKEAQAEFYHHPELTKAKVRQYDFGAKGALREFQSTGKHMCMYRESLDEVLQTVLNSKKGQRKDLVLDGWTGSGKSVALYALVAAARASGWVVMYVPSASLLVQGGVFKKRSDEDAMFHTPVAAQHVLRGVYEAHKDVLGSLPSADRKSTIGDVCAAGLESPDPFAKVDAAAGVLKGLLMADGENDLRTLVVVDDYNYLYHRTSYHETVHRFHRRRLEPRELVLASAFMMLEDQGRTSGVAAIAPTYGGPVSPQADVPLTISETTILRMPRFSLQEVATMVSMQSGGAPDVPDDTLRRALALSNGNGRDLREKKTTLFQMDNGVELSRGNHSRIIPM